ncbi:hypothetical protein [Kitasatospora sp. MMS16-BH015]|uniref:hypothetical protein n=1 Tax=Kitasatospora sp. MMS16-BH015 TaxID=2018025 RepID=UPI000CF2A68B|nr:hypothetical protein [Kitasatospora sp. MMS16-BH015]
MSVPTDQPGPTPPDTPSGTESSRDLLVRLREGAAAAPSAEAATHLLGLVARELTALVGRYDREALITWRELGRQTCLAGETSAAVHLLGQVLTDLAQALGPTDPDTLTAHLELATALGEDGDPRTAAQRLGELLPVLHAAFGPADPRTLATRCRLAVNTGRLGETAAAYAQLHALVADLQQHLPPEHPLLAEARSALGRVAAAGGGTPGAPATRIEILALVHRLLVWDFDTDEEATACLDHLGRLTGKRHLTERLTALPDNLTPEEAATALLA